MSHQQINLNSYRQQQYWYIENVMRQYRPKEAPLDVKPAQMIDLQSSVPAHMPVSDLDPNDGC